MERFFTRELERWERNKTKEPILITGVRQVGKTWLIRDFCEKTFRDYLYVNLESQPEIVSVFEESLQPEEIIRNLELVTGRHITPGETALVFDEIQRSERAVTAMKYFCEAETNYRVIGAGSLLGVKIHRFSSSFPVGKVRLMNMHPMRFDEFLLACGEDILCEAIQEHVGSMCPMPEAVHNRANRLYHDYLFVGGMPQAVADYINCGKDVLRFDRSIHSNLLTAYTADMTKYTFSPAEAVKIAQTYASVPRQLAKENPKFMYKDIREYANKRDFVTALDLLTSSGLVLKSSNVSVPKSPLSAYAEEGMFKLYLSDTGLLGTAAGLQYQDLLPESDNIFKGAVAENYVMQTLAVNGHASYYYKPSQNLEIDQLISGGEGVIPIEVKEGRHRRSTSLKNYMDQFHPSKAYRLSENNFGISDRLYSVPLYAAFCL